MERTPTSSTSSVTMSDEDPPVYGTPEFRRKWKEENFAKHYGMKDSKLTQVRSHAQQQKDFTQMMKDEVYLPKNKRTDMWKEFMAMKLKLSQIKDITEEIQVAGVRGDTDFHKLAMHAIFKITHE